jgi:predicted AAA+ superfamily ATPase
MTGLRKRLARVLELAEQWLEARTPVAPDAASAAQYHAFRWDARRGPGRLVPIAFPEPMELRDLIGVEGPIEELVRNTEQFVRGLPANHVLLHGERGTGKSSAVKGLLTRFAPRGLRLVEVRKGVLVDLPDIIAALRGLEHPFLIYCDDLAFDVGERGMRELKAALEGSVEATPENLRIIATSNRRHLVPKLVADNRDAALDEHGELHVGEAIEDKLSLADRFGLVLGFFKPDQDTYLRGNRSGRTARQFVDDAVGRAALGDGGEVASRASSSGSL